MEINDKLLSFMNQENYFKEQIDEYKKRLEKIQSEQKIFIGEVIKASTFNVNALFDVLVDLFRLYEAPKEFKVSGTGSDTIIISSNGGEYLVPKDKSFVSSSEIITLEVQSISLFKEEKTAYPTFLRYPQYISDFILYVVANRMKSPFDSNDVKRLLELQKSFLVNRKDEIEKRFDDILQADINEANNRAFKRNLVLQELIGK